jgi:hypothetical protein
MGIIATRTLPEDIRTLGHAGIGAGYAAVGIPLLKPSLLMIITNETDVPLLISFDGVDDHIFLGSLQSLTLNFASNSVGDYGLFIANNTTIYAKEAAAGPTTGSLWLTSFYPKTGGN